MRKLFLGLLLTSVFISCEQPVEKVRGIPSDARVQAEKPDNETLERELKEKGYQTFLYKDGDTTYLMQQYFIVFLKSGLTGDRIHLLLQNCRKDIWHISPGCLKKDIQALPGLWAMMEIFGES